jgi:hypothetical protein
VWGLSCFVSLFLCNTIRTLFFFLLLLEILLLPFFLLISFLFFYIFFYRDVSSAPGLIEEVTPPL